MFSSNSQKTIALTVGTAATVFLLSAIVLAWNEPPASPPGGNVPPPLRSESSDLNLSGSTWSERNVTSINAITGYNDIFLKSNPTENATIYLAGSQLSFYSGGTEKWKIDSTGSLTVGSVPWTRLTTFPSACDTGKYVSAVGSTLTCSTPPGGTLTDTRCDTSGTCSQVCIGTSCQTSWPTGVTDHGALTGLGDNDHPQYILDAGDTMTGLLNISLASDEKLRLKDDATRYYSFNVGDDGALAIKDEGGNVRLQIDNSGNLNLGENLIIGKTARMSKLHLQPTSQPATAEEGDIYFDSIYHKLCYYDGTGWSCVQKPKCYCDEDGDGRYSIIAKTVDAATCVAISCSDDPGNDCDDNCTTCYPGSLEYTTQPDGHDQNCNGETDETFRKSDHVCDSITYSADAHPRAPVASVEEQCNAYCGFAGGQVGCAKESSYNYSRINLSTCSGEGRIYGNLMSCCKYNARITCACIEVYR